MAQEILRGQKGVGGGGDVDARVVVWSGSMVCAIVSQVPYGGVTTLIDVLPYGRVMTVWRGDCGAGSGWVIEVASWLNDPSRLPKVMWAQKLNSAFDRTECEAHASSHTHTATHTHSHTPLPAHWGR